MVSPFSWQSAWFEADRVLLFMYWHRHSRISISTKSFIFCCTSVQKNLPGLRHDHFDLQTSRGWNNRHASVWTQRGKTVLYEEFEKSIIHNMLLNPTGLSFRKQLGEQIHLMNKWPSSMLINWPFSGPNTDSHVHLIPHERWWRWDLEFNWWFFTSHQDKQNTKQEVSSHSRTIYWAKPIQVLTGKYGEDSKLIYDLADQGGEILALRFCRKIL